ncbi:MAG: hypothetical protein ACYC6L_06795 [Anaerolineae bacterium]
MSRIILCIALAAVLLAGCGASGGPSKDVDLTGNISDISPATNAPILGAIRVEGQKIAANRWPAAWVTISPDTLIWQKTGSGYARASFANLAVGDTVTVKTTGIVLESDPVQVGATEVVILAHMPQN